MFAGPFFNLVTAPKRENCVMTSSRHMLRAFCVTSAALALLVPSNAVVAQALRIGTDTALDTAVARQGALGSQVAYVPLMVEVGRDEHTFTLTAPLQHQLTERTAFVSELATYGRPTPYSSETQPRDLAAQWHYRHRLQVDPAFTIGYTARARFDTAADTSESRPRSEYLVRLDVERDIARFTPRIEVGYRFAPHALGDSTTPPRLFSAVGTTYHFSDRASVEFFFDQRAPLAGGVSERELSLAWSQRTSAQTRIIFYAVKSVSDSWYDAGLKLSVRF